jgi:hypothetical protein
VAIRLGSIKNTGSTGLSASVPIVINPFAVAACTVSACPKYSLLSEMSSSSSVAPGADWDSVSRNVCARWSPSNTAVCWPYSLSSGTVTYQIRRRPRMYRKTYEDRGVRPPHSAG